MRNENSLTEHYFDAEEQCDQIFENNSKAIIYVPHFPINPPPRDLNCEDCGKKFEDLPSYPEEFSSPLLLNLYTVSTLENEKRVVRLYKDFRIYSGSISAVWVCNDCFNANKRGDNENLREDELITPWTSIDTEGKHTYSRLIRVDYCIIMDALKLRRSSFKTGIGSSCIHNCEERLNSLIEYLEKQDASILFLSAEEFEVLLRKIEEANQACCDYDRDDLEIIVKISIMDQLVIYEALRYYWDNLKDSIIKIDSPEFIGNVQYLIQEFKYVEVDDWKVSIERIIKLLNKGVKKFINLTISSTPSSGACITVGVATKILEASDSGLENMMVEKPKILIRKFYGYGV